MKSLAKEKLIEETRRIGKRSHMKTQITITITALIFSTTISFAADTKISKKDRQKMAEIHTKMATCLQSDKSMSDCQNEMMKSCKGIMEKSRCPMMEMGHMKGMMMDQEEETKFDKKNKE
jgi:hypothetical protein